MKKFILSIALLLIGVLGYSQRDISRVFAQATLTNADTLIQYPVGSSAEDLKGAWDYSVICQADSISGTTAGNVYVEVSNGTIWVAVDTLAIADVAQTVGEETGTIYSRFMRVRTITTGTQSTGLTTELKLVSK